MKWVYVIILIPGFWKGVSLEGKQACSSCSELQVHFWRDIAWWHHPGQENRSPGRKWLPAELTNSEVLSFGKWIVVISIVNGKRKEERPGSRFATSPGCPCSVKDGVAQKCQHLRGMEWGIWSLLRDDRQYLLFKLMLFLSPGLWLEGVLGKAELQPWVH